MPSQVGQYLGWRNAAFTGRDDNRYALPVIAAVEWRYFFFLARLKISLPS